MYSVTKIDDIYIAKHTCNVSIPEYLYQLPTFLSTLKNLYTWRNHQVNLKEIVLQAAIEKEDNDFFSNVACGDDNNCKALSPNIYLTPTKPKNHN